MEGQSFNPSNIEVEVGTTITWENKSNETHTVTSGSSGNHDGNFDSGNIAPGGEYSYTFNEVGEFDYYCIPHPNMTGTVTVVEASGSNGY
jgi:plastocyanin